MRRQPAGVLLDVSDAVELEPVLRALAGVHHATGVRHLADALAGLLADTRPSNPGQPWTVADDSTIVDVMTAAAALRCSPRTVRRRAAAGTVPARKVAGRWQIGATA